MNLLKTVTFIKYTRWIALICCAIFQLYLIFLIQKGETKRKMKIKTKEQAEKKMNEDNGRVIFTGIVLGCITWCIQNFISMCLVVLLGYPLLKGLIVSLLLSTILQPVFWIIVLKGCFETNKKNMTLL